MRAALLILLALTLHTFAAPSHWAYTEPQRPALPKTDSDWPRNPIDYFILAKQKENQLAPSPAASPGQLLRRVHLDLTGLPPTPDVVALFLENPSDTAYEMLRSLVGSEMCIRDRVFLGMNAGFHVAGGRAVKAGGDALAGRGIRQ